MTRTGTIMARLKARGLRSAVAFAVVFAVAGNAIAVDAGPHPEDEEARRIIETADIHGGLVVHIGCRDGKLTAALGTNDSYLVHGLDRDSAKVAQARRHIQKRGLYGRVSVTR